MNLQLIEKIFELCPTIYRSKFDDFIDVRCIFECDDCWGTFIYNTSLQLEKMALAELEAGIPIDEVTKVHKFEQKSKIFYSYITTSNSAAKDLIDQFEQQVFNICEICGDVCIKDGVGRTQQLVCTKCKKV